MEVYKYLHLMHNDKFIEPFIIFIKEHFTFSEHYFILVGGVSKKIANVPDETNVLYLDHSYNQKHNYFKLSKKIDKYVKNSQKIFLHSLFKTNIMNYFLIHKYYLKKSYWIIWGGDLYSLIFPNKNITKYKQFEYKISEMRKKSIVKHIGGIICYNYAEYKLAQKHAGATGIFIESFFYPSNLYKPLDIKEKKSNIINIQIGNSANPSNNHIEILKNLKQYADEEIAIYLPLSYGDVIYQDKVVKIGHELFGNKFHPLVEFMPLNSYINFLGTIDIAIFNHYRQQALGNITTLLGLGKKVYINSSVITWDLMRDNDIKVYDTKKFKLTLIDEIIKKKNIKNVKDYFSKKNLISQWNSIFQSKVN